MLARAVKTASLVLADAQTGNPALAGMGTTLTALLINARSATVAHIGDSRVYQLRGKHKVFRTYDHSQVFEMLRAGAFKSEEEALSRANSNVITRAIGPMPDPQPDIVELPYEKGDRFVLCSDGLWGAMPEKQFIKIAGGTPSLPGAVESLAITADENGKNEGGGHDNLTLAIVQTLSNSKLKQKMSTNVKRAFMALCAICCISLVANFIQYRTHRAPAPAKTEAATSQQADVMKQIESLRKENEQIQKKLEENEKRNREQDAEYLRRLKEFGEKMQANTENTAAAGKAVTKDLDDAKAEAAAVDNINKLIKHLEDLKDVSNKDQLKAGIEKAKKMLETVKKDVKTYGVSDSKFESCEQEIGKKLMFDPNHNKRKGQINYIIEALKNVRDAIKKKS